MLILRTLVMGPAHGYTIAQVIESTSENALEVEQGSLYPALHRLEDRGLVSSEWGVIESDRIRALATELRRLGATVVENDDGLEIAPSAMHPAAVETYDDHRIAMSFAVTGLKLGGVKIKQPGCVGKTFPDFFDRLAALS